MLWLAFDDAFDIPGEPALDANYWWVLEHTGFDVLGLCKFACGRSLGEFKVDANAPGVARKALELLEYMDPETREEEREGLVEEANAELPWYEPSDAASLARSFVRFLRERPACTGEPPFADFADWQVQGYQAAREEVIRVYEQVAALLDAAAARSARFRFIVPKGRAEELFRASNKLSRDWWQALRGV